MIEWQDLLGVPFLAAGEDPTVGLDCWGQARVLHARAGRALPDIGALRPTVEASVAALEPLVPIDRPERELDLAFWDPASLGYLSHVATIVDARYMIALSVSARHGPYAWPLARMLSRGGDVVYRRAR